MRTNFRKTISVAVALLALTGATVATTAPAEAVNGVRVHRAISGT